MTIGSFKKTLNRVGLLLYGMVADFLNTELPDCKTSTPTAYPLALHPVYKPMPVRKTSRSVTNVIASRVGAVNHFPVACCVVRSTHASLPILHLVENFSRLCFFLFTKKHKTDSFSSAVNKSFPELMSANSVGFITGKRILYSRSPSASLICRPVGSSPGLALWSWCLAQLTTVSYTINSRTGMVSISRMVSKACRDADRISSSVRTAFALAEIGLRHSLWSCWSSKFKLSSSKLITLFTSRLFRRHERHSPTNFGNIYFLAAYIKHPADSEHIAVLSQYM